MDCQYTFGVFTKWDVLEEKSKQQEGNAPNIDPKYLREKNKEKFLNSVNDTSVRTGERKKNKEKSLNSVNDRCTENDIFFVDSQHVFRRKNPEASISPIVS